MPSLCTDKQTHPTGIHIAPTHLYIMLSFGNILRELKNKIHTAVRRKLEEMLEVTTFFKMSIGFKCRGPKAELRFCSFLECVHFSTAGTDKEK